MGPMRKLLITLALTAAIPMAACSDPANKSTPEEDYWMTAYAVINSAYAYDHVCKQDQNLKNPVLTGNMNMIATQVYTSLRNNHEGAPDDVFKKAVKQSGKTMYDKEVEMLNKQGCDADALKPFNAALDRYTKAGPNDNYVMLMEDMDKKGIVRAIPKAPPEATPSDISGTPVDEAPADKTPAPSPEAAPLQGPMSTPAH